MKKLITLFGLTLVLAGCAPKNEETTTPPADSSAPSTNAVPDTNAPAKSP